MLRNLLIFFLILLFSHCVDQQKEPPAKEETAQNPAPDKVFITKQQMDAVGIVLEKIENKDLQNTVRANGMLTVPNQNKAFITSVASGVIKTLNIQPGTLVHKGQAVASIANPDMAHHQQELQTVNAQISMAETEYRRQQELVDGAAAPLKNLQRVQTELTTLKASRNALQHQLTEMGISVEQVRSGNITTSIAIRAPITGTVSNVSSQIGSNVDAATPIGEIVNNEQLHVDLFVYEKDLPLLKSKETIHFTLTNNPGKEYDAEIFSVGSAFVKETRTIPVHAIVKGDKTGLIEGMNITALISVGQQVSPAVPTASIVTDQGQDYIFMQVATPSGKDSAGIQLQRVPVIKGISEVGYTAIHFLHPVLPGNLVVTKGAFFILAKMINTGDE